MDIQRGYFVLADLHAFSVFTPVEDGADFQAAVCCDATDETEHNVQTAKADGPPSCG